MENKTARLLEAIDHPESFSDEELSMLLNDPETMELYKLMNRTSNLLTETSEPDIDEEWNRFIATRTTTFKKKPWCRLTPKAAAAVIAIVASLAVVAATIGFSRSFSRNEPFEITESKPKNVNKSSVESIQLSAPKAATSSPEVIVFKDETLEHVLKDISRYYGVSVSFKNNKIKDLRLYFKWNQAHPLNEILEQLNSFEQISLSLNNNIITVE